jgi:hypothetical protein
MAKHTKFLTNGGVLLDYTNFRKEDINLQDIAHHLANERRYGGALPLDTYFSVACHSINMANFVFELTTSLNYEVEDVKRLMRYALFHDASEAYLKDIPSGLKALLPEYKILEKKFSDVIFKKYGIEENDYITDVIDKCMFLDEVIVLRPEHYGIYSRYNDNKPLQWKIKKYTPEESKEMFLIACEELGITDDIRDIKPHLGFVYERFKKQV